ncbi:MAG: hypothetical protein Q7T81_00945 [Pseudolabrys sp.]|nr:hypothetical protein [Pseudolabrys sp.]
MVATIARGLFLFALAIMIVTWVMTPGNTEPTEPEPAPASYRMYS